MKSHRNTNSVADELENEMTLQIGEKYILVVYSHTRHKKV